MSSETNLCLVGDRNIDIFKPSKSVVCDYLSLLADNGIRTTIPNPIRKEVVNGNLVSSCLDHINVRTTDASIHAAVIRRKLANHYFFAWKCVFISKEYQNTGTIC